MRTMAAGLLAAVGRWRSLVLGARGMCTRGRLNFIPKISSLLSEPSLRATSHVMIDEQASERAQGEGRDSA